MLFSDSYSNQQLERNTSFSGNLAFVVVVAAGYVVVLTAMRLSTLDLALLIGGGVVYTVMGIFGMYTLQKLPSPWWQVIYFGLQVPLGCWMMYLGGGNGWLFPLPIVSQAVVALERRWMLFITAMIVLGMLTPFIAQLGWTGAIGMSMSVVAAVFFVVLFTQIAVNEQEARTEAQNLAVQLEAANKKLSDYALQVEELAIAEERNRLAREIHDGLGHYLTAIHMQLKAAAALLDIEPASARQAVEKAEALSQEALADVRRSVAALRNLPTSRRPLAQVIQALLEEVRATGVETRFVELGEVRLLEPPVELTLYRAAQEGLTNVRKHAAADQVHLTLDYSKPDQVQLSIRDNGRGVQDPSGGYGLLGLRERAKLAGGAVEVESAPGAGFTLLLTVRG